MKKALLFPLLASLAYANTQINSVQFENLSRISPKVALENIDMKKGESYDAKKINEAIKTFYQFGYFDDISVEDNDGNIIFKFTEKPSIVNIEINGYKTREEDLQVLYSSMGIKKGSMFSDQRIANAKNAILENLRQEGYYNSVVEVSTEKISTSAISLTFDVNKGEPIIINKINYKGAKFLDESDFDDVVANKEIESFSWFIGRNSGEMKLEQLQYENRRIEELYRENGFLDIKVSKAFSKIDFNTNTSELDFSINEGNQYSVGDVIIFLDSNIKDPKSLYEELKLKKDKIFNIKDLRKDIEYIKTQVADLGYAFADVKYDIQKDEKNNIASVQYNVIPGQKVYINDVIISGNSRTLDRVIRRDVYLAPGDLFSLTDYKDSKSALGRSGFFENVQIDQQRISADKMNILVNVSEAKTGNLILGGGYGSYDGMMINASINDKNIFGSGKTLGFSVEASERSMSYDISIKNPAINDSEYSGSFHIYNTTSEIDSYDETDAQTYTLTVEKTGMSVGAGKKISRHTGTGATYKLESVTQTDTDPSESNESYITSSITPYINYNTTDDFYLPRNGSKFNSSIEIAGLGGDSKYIKNINTFKTFHSLEKSFDKDWIIRYRASIKILEDLGQINDGDSFYLGGMKSVRGYQSYAFGPDDTNEAPYKRFAANTIELNMPLIPKAKMRWGVFLDAGTIGKDDFTEITKAGYGAQLEWFSPVGPIAFVFANPLNADTGDKTSSFEFSLGSSF